MKKETGPFKIGDDEYDQDAWRMYTQGLLVALGNESAHFIKGIAEEMALGIAGAVSVVLLKMDEVHGVP